MAGRRVLVVAAVLLACCPAALALNDLYWDTNGTTAGSGVATGTWGVSNFWTTDPDGVANAFQTATSSTNDVHFSAGTNGGSGTITVSGNQFANGIYFEESPVTISGGSVTLSDGAIINNTETVSIPTLTSALVATGSVTLTGTRVWLNNSSFNGGGTLNVNSSNATLLENSGALNGLSTINVNSGGLDVRVNQNGSTNYNYAAGTTTNFINTSSLTTNLAQSVTWKGNITVAATKTATLSNVNVASTFTMDGNISGAGAVTISGTGPVVFTGTNTYAGTTTINATTLRITGGSAIGDTGLVSMQGGTTNTLDVQTSETLGGLSGGTAAFSVVNLAAGQTLTLSAGTQTFNGTFSGTGKLVVAGATQTLASSVTLTDLSVNSGTLNLSAANNVSDGLVITGGTVQLRDAAAAGANAIQASGGTIQAAVARGSTLSIANAINVSQGSHVILSPQINGGTTGTATVNYAGTMTINPGGILQLGAPGSNAAFGTGNGAIAFAANAVSGTKFQLNGVAFSTAGLSTDTVTPGAPMVENGSASATTLTVALPTSSTSMYAGTLRDGGTGTLGLTLNGGTGSTLVLAGANTNSGPTNVTAGSLNLANSQALQNSTVATGGTGIVFDSSVVSHAFTFGGLSGTADLALQDNASNAVTLSVGNNGSTQSYSGILSGAGGLTKVGSGTQTLIGANTYTGNTSVNGGTLITDFSISGAPASNIINPTSTLMLGGGIYTERQTTNLVANGQTFNGVAVRAGSSVVNQIRGGAGVLLLTLGAVGRDIGGTVAFSANGSGTSGIAATGVNTASGIIGGWATYLTTNGGATTSNTTDWATYSGGKIVALSPGSYSNTAATTASTNLDMTANVTLNANGTTGSIRFNNAITTPTLTLNGTNTVDSGGILVTANVGPNATLITGGALTSGNGQDIIITQNNTNAGGALTVDAVLTGAVGLTKSGAGQLTLSGSNDYTGATYLNGGVTSISSNANLGSVTVGAAVNLNGGTLSAAASLDLDNGGSNQRNLTVGNNGGTLDVAAGQTLTVRGAISGSGTLNKSGLGSLILGGPNSQTGNTNVTAGNLQVGVAGTGQSGPGGVTVNGSGAVLSGSGVVQGSLTVTSGTLRPGDNGGTGLGTLTTGDLTLNPAASSNVVEFQITGSAGAGSLSADKVLINGALTLNGNSNIVVDGSGYTPTLGDTFVLMDWTTALDTGLTSVFNVGANGRTGANVGNEGNLDLPDLSASGLTWDIRDFSGSGSLTIVVTPEPSRAILSLLGVMAFSLRRRRWGK
jgi:autotransporter-associated beta strand protein